MTTTEWALIVVGVWFVVAIAVWAILTVSHREDHDARKQERDDYNTDVTVTRTGTHEQHSSER